MTTSCSSGNFHLHETLFSALVQCSEKSTITEELKVMESSFSCQYVCISNIKIWLNLDFLADAYLQFENAENHKKVEIFDSKLLLFLPEFSLEGLKIHLNYYPLKLIKSKFPGLIKTGK